MFGMMEALLSFIRRQVGLRTDAASATGSLHAKVTEAKESITASVGTSQKPRGLVARVSNTVTASGYTTVLDVTGKGRLLGLRYFGWVGETFGLRITIDGVVFGGTDNWVNSDKNGYLTNIWFLDPIKDNVSLDPATATVDVSFKQSLKIETYCSGSEQKSIRILYEIE